MKLQPAILLMLLSLLLLAAFEGVWLKNEYHKEKDLLNQHETHQFQSAIRLIEDSLFSVMALEPFHLQLDSFELVAPEGRSLRFEHQDSAEVITFVRSIDVREVRNKTQERISATSRPKGRRSMLLGALTLRLAAKPDSSYVSSQLLSMIESRVGQVESAAPELNYQIISWQNNEPVDVQGLMSSPYFDVWSQQSFAMVYPRYKGYLLKQMLPQIAFVLFLFGCIFVAFWMVYRNLLRQEKLAEMRNDFISNITHELKTPISTVRVALEALTNFDITDKAKTQEYIEISQAEIDRLTLLVDKVLQMSKMNEGHAELKIENFDAKELITQILGTLKVQFTRKRASVSFDSVGEEFSLRADRLHITGVLYNLLDNAMKYSSPNPQIDVKLVQNNGEVTISVSDSGKGIPEAYRDKVFDKFFRVPNGNAHNIKGYGLGLSYVAEVARQHHGMIAVESNSQGGAHFSFTIPRMHEN